MVVRQQGVCRLPLMSHLFMIQRLVNNTVTFFLSKYRCVCEDHRPEVVNWTVTVWIVFFVCLFLSLFDPQSIFFGCFLVELMFSKWKFSHINVDFWLFLKNRKWTNASLCFSWWLYLNAYCPFRYGVCSRVFHSSSPLRMALPPRSLSSLILPPWALETLKNVTPVLELQGGYDHDFL